MIFAKKYHLNLKIEAAAKVGVAIRGGLVIAGSYILFLKMHVM